MIDLRISEIQSIEDLHVLPAVFTTPPPFPRKPGPYNTEEGAGCKLEAIASAKVSALARPVSSNFFSGLLSGHYGETSERPLVLESFWRMFDLEGMAIFEKGRYRVEELKIVRLRES